MITMTAKIDELAKKFDLHLRKAKFVPMPTTGYIIKDEAYLLHENSKIAEYLKEEDIVLYMQLVGAVLWIQGIRLDITFAVMYLTWYTHSPRQHHLNMVRYVIQYLYETKDIPLVLGGSPVIQINSYTDSSFGTAPKGRSVSGQLQKLNSESGAVSAKSTATATVLLSSCESELDSCSTGFKSINRLSNLL
jgi:hypothetical protein